MFDEAHVPYIMPEEHDACIGASLRNIPFSYDSDNSKTIYLSYYQIFVESKFEQDANGVLSF
jgi:hypothetical protein